MVVPGSILGGLNHPFSWCARVREKQWGKKEFTYWLNGVQLTRERVATFIAKTYPHVDVLRIEPVTRMPTQPLFPVPAHHFQFGVLAAKLERLAALQADSGRVTVMAQAKTMIRGFSLNDPLARRRLLCPQNRLLR